MTYESKTTKSIKNVFFGVLSQLFIVLIRFVSRTIFIKLLAAEYLGINGLFSNILSVLSLVDLGFSGAIIYSLYKPLVKNNKNKIAGLINYYKKIYNIFATIILIMGLLLIPFLKYIVNLPNDIPDIKLYYGMFLINTVASYFFAYKNTILEADQKSYIIRVHQIISFAIQFLLQLIVLLLFHNYLLYLIVQLLSTILYNVLGVIKVNKLYPFIINNKSKLSKKDKICIYNNVKAMFINKISNVILTNTDNILISIIVGTIIVGYYSNYFLIVSSITAFITIIYTSLLGSIGQFNSQNTALEKEKIFKVLNFISFIICGTSSLCMLLLFSDFIKIWIGNTYLLEDKVLYIIVINFYLTSMLSPINIFRDTTGLFNDTKFVYLLASILNIILSIILGKHFGLFGILIATVISKLLTFIWYEPYIIYKKVFLCSVKKYYLNQLLKIFYVFFLYYIEYQVINKLFVDNNIKIFVLKLIIVLFTNIIVLCLLLSKSEEFNLFNKKILKKILKKEVK